MILGVPGTDLALTQRLVPLSGPHKKSTRRLVSLQGPKSPHKGLISTRSFWQFYYIVLCCTIEFEDLLVIGTRCFKFPTQALWNNKRNEFRLDLFDFEFKNIKCSNVVNLKQSQSRPCENSLANVCTSALPKALKINLLYHKKQMVKFFEVQKSAR